MTQRRRFKFYRLFGTHLPEEDLRFAEEFCRPGFEFQEKLAEQLPAPSDESPEDFAAAQKKKAHQAHKKRSKEGIKMAARRHCSR